MTATANGKADRLGRYFTDPRVSRAIIRHLPIWRDGLVVLEPSCGSGSFLDQLVLLQAARQLQLYLYGLDVDENAPAMVGPADALLYCRALQDFLQPSLPDGWPRPDVVIGNPPYSEIPEDATRAVEVASDHAQRALAVTRRHVVMLLPTAFLGATRKRFPWWKRHRRHLRDVWLLWPRPSFTGGGTDSREFAVFWWDLEHDNGWTAEHDHDPGSESVLWLCGADLHFLQWRPIP